MGKRKIILALMLSVGFTLSGCKESRSQENAEVTDFCAQIQERFQDGTLDEILIGDLMKNFKTSFFVDIDNDGQDEELKYYGVGNHGFLFDMRNGKKGTWFTPYARDAHYSYTKVLNYDDKFYLLFVAKDLLEIQKLTEISEEAAKQEIPMEMRKLRFNNKNYQVDLICKYYDD